jgi:hypothetical protein
MSYLKEAWGLRDWTGEEVDSQESNRGCSSEVYKVQIKNLGLVAAKFINPHATPSSHYAIEVGACSHL